MPRFYLNLFNRVGPVPDEEGSEAEDLPAARDLAVQSIRDILSEEARTGAIDLNGRIEITDGEGRLLDTLFFADAVRIRRAGDPS